MGTSTKKISKKVKTFSNRYLVICSLVIFGGFVLLAGASSPFDIEFPIQELENCANKDECKAYCDDFSNQEACAAFGKKHGLIDGSRAETTQKLPPKGPGGCVSERDCRNYCEEVDHVEECMSFAETHGLIDKSEIKRAREFVGQTGPGGCRGAKECRTYCDDASHRRECLDFAKRKGLISEQNIKVAEKVLEDGGPGGCRGDDECRKYCEDPANINECVQFGEDQGFISKDEAARVKKTFGKGPGGCQGKSACEAYCHDLAHQNECIDFGVENGFMTKEEAERAKKFAGKTGPGGCRGEECRAFCEKPENGEVCLEHAEREGLMPKEEIERAKKFMQASKEGGPGGCRGQQCRDYCQDPAHREECFGFAKKQGLIRPEDEESFEAGQKLNKKLQEAGGPGGCRSEDECKVYCTDPAHTEECVAFAATHGGVSKEQAQRMLREFTERRFEVQTDFEGGFRPSGDFHRFEEEGRRRFEEFSQLEEQFRGHDFEGFEPPSGGMGGFPGGPGEFHEGEEGQPGRFGSGPGEGRFPSGFAGPGGCASPVECIKYCSEHKDECFGFSGPSSGGPIGRPLGGPHGRGEGFRKEMDAPRLKTNLIQEFKQGELPENFHQQSFEERQRFFMERSGPNPETHEGVKGITEQFGRCISDAIKSGGSEKEARKKCEEGFSRPLENFPDRGRNDLQKLLPSFGGRNSENHPEQLPQEFKGGMDQLRGGEFPFRSGGFQQNMREGSGGFHPEGQGLPNIPGAFEPRPGGSGGGEFRGIPGQFNPQGTGQRFDQSSGVFPRPGEGDHFSPPPGNFTPPGGFQNFAPRDSGAFGSQPPPSGSFGGEPSLQPSNFQQSPPSPTGSQPPPPPSGFRHLREFFASVLNLIPIGE